MAHVHSARVDEAVEQDASSDEGLPSTHTQHSPTSKPSSAGISKVPPKTPKTLHLVLYPAPSHGGSAAETSEAPWQ